MTTPATRTSPRRLVALLAAGVALVALGLPGPAAATTPDQPGPGLPTFGCPALVAGVGGTLVKYDRNCYGFLDEPPVTIGTGFDDFTLAVRTDFDSNGCGDIIGVRSDGNLYAFMGGPEAGTCADGLAPAVKLGNGWDEITTLLAPGDWNGDGCRDLLAVTTVGDLLQYPGNCRGGFGTSGLAKRVGSGWDTFTTVVAPGSFDRDGCVDLLGITSSGDLYRYLGNCHGGFAPDDFFSTHPVGNGWDSFTLVATIGDADGDGCGDLIAVDGLGDMRLYPADCGRGSGSTFARGAGDIVGNGWENVDRIL